MSPATTATPNIQSGAAINPVVDALTNTIYVTDMNSAAVSVLNDANCRAGRTRGCGTADSDLKTAFQAPDRPFPAPAARARQAG